MSSGRVQITHDLQQDITGRHLIIVEDILDSGNTLAFLKDYFMTKGAASITIVTLLDKPPAGLRPSPPTGGVRGAGRVCGGVWAGLLPAVPERAVHRVLKPEGILRE